MILSHCQMIQASNDAAARAVAKQSAMPVTVASSTTTSSSSSSSPSSSLFPSKLHAMLEDASEKGFDDIVCWMPGGSSFKVLDTHRFSLSVMPQYFNQRKYKSFLRQLNLYGFARIHHGPHKGGYAHKFFLQGMPDFCERINKDFPRIKEQTVRITPLRRLCCYHRLFFHIIVAHSACFFSSLSDAITPSCGFNRRFFVHHL